MLKQARIRSLVAAAIVGVASTASAGTIDFVATDGDQLYRANSLGAVQGPFTLSAAVQSLTRLPSGYTLPGASAGDIIAMARSASPGGRYAIYRMDDPGGAASLTQIGSVDQGIGSLEFANGKIFGVDDSANALRVYEIDPVTGNSTVTYNTGIAASGGGGLAYDDIRSVFYLTDFAGNRLYTWVPGGSATLVGNVGFGFQNHGIEFQGGMLYGALRLDSPGSTMRVGSFDLTTGAFTTLATITGVAGNGTGFVAVPEPGTTSAVLLGLGLLAARRRPAR